MMVTQLLQSAQTDVHSIQSALDAQPSIVNEFRDDARGRTALMLACESGNMSAATVLVRAGADLHAHAHDDGDSTALSIAIAAKHLPIVVMLIKMAGNEVTRMLNEKSGPRAMTSALWSCVCACDSIDKDGSDSNTSMSSSFAITDFLLKSGADFSGTCSEGWTALMYCCKSGDLNAAHKMLITMSSSSSTSSSSSSPSEVTAYVNARNAMGHTALAIAAAYDRADIGRLLVQYGANVNAVTTMDNSSPLLIACKKKSIAFASFMMSSVEACRVDRQDAAGWSPLIVCAANGCVDLVTILVNMMMRHMMMMTMMMLTMMMRKKMSMMSMMMRILMMVMLIIIIRIVMQYGDDELDANDDDDDTEDEGDDDDDVLIVCLSPSVCMCICIASAQSQRQLGQSQWMDSADEGV